MRAKIKTKNKIKKILSVFITLILAAGFIYFWIVSNMYETTDDAFIEGHIIKISPKISGTIEKLYVEDNQHVKKGDLLLVIDEKDYKAKYDLARATHAKILSSQSAARSSLNAQNQNLKTAKDDLDRYTNLYKEGAVSKQDYEKALNKFTAALASQKAAEEKVFSSNNSKMADAERQEAESLLEQAKLQLSYSKIYAPQDGIITSRTAEEGAFIHAGAPLFAIVSDERWVVANFKETQLKNMKIGQTVDIKIDTYPNKKFKGKIDSIQASTGSKTSLFPPENAVGSYVKIVQRIPVKITFDTPIDDFTIVPGMSVVPKVKVK